MIDVRFQRQRIDILQLGLCVDVPVDCPRRPGNGDIFDMIDIDAGARTVTIAVRGVETEGTLCDFKSVQIPDGVKAGL